MLEKIFQTNLTFQPCVCCQLQQALRFVDDGNLTISRRYRVISFLFWEPWLTL